MVKYQRKSMQAAQGMVEFALVLPILLLLVFGVFAFGHLLFAYSSVVSASREAARWAAAVGEPGSATPRYKDCNAIMDAAARVGSFAGVASQDPSSLTPAMLPQTTDPQSITDPGIVIWYDPGPGKALTDNIGNFCRAGSTGEDVDLGDRVNVRVVVMYRPIVPLVNIPSFPLVATTARTIIRGVSVGAAPTSKAACNWTAIHMTVSSNGAELAAPYQVVVGQPVTFTFEVASPDGLLDKGTLVLTIEGTQYPYSPPTGPAGSKTYQFGTVGTGANAKVIQADYYPDTVANMGGKCYQLSTISIPVEVNKADTSIIVFTDPANPPVDKPSEANKNTQVPVYFSVTVDPPGTNMKNTPAGTVVLNTPTGLVTVKDETSVISKQVNLSAGSAPFIWTAAGDYLLSGVYVGDANYNGSTFPDPLPPVPPDPTKYFKHTVTVPVVPTCPKIDKSSLVFNAKSGNNWMSFKIDNPPAGSPASVPQLILTWPAPTPPNTAVMILTQVCTRDTASTNNCTGTGYTTVWSGALATIPTTVSLAPASATTMAPGASKYFYLTFNMNPAKGTVLYTSPFAIEASFLSPIGCPNDKVIYP